MTAQFCTSCGRPTTAGASICPTCGALAPASEAGPPKYGPGNMPVYSNWPPGAYAVVGTPRRPNLTTWVQDRGALRALTLAVIIGLAGAITEVVIDILPSVQGLVVATTKPNGTVVHLPSPWLWVALLTVGGALAVAEVLLIRISFTDLRTVDDRFSGPATLALLALLGILLGLVGVALLLHGIYAAVACAGSGHPLTLSCLYGSGFVVGVIVLLIGAILGLVGYLGILIGIWRFGSRYDDSSFKVGVILLIFPVLNVVGAILILLGARKALHRIGTGTSAPPAAVY